MTDGIWLNMRAASGIVRGEMRRLREKLHTPDTLYNTIVMSQDLSFAKKCKLIERELNDFRGYSCIGQRDKNSMMVTLAVVTAYDGVDIYTLRIGKSEIAPATPVVGASHHALARAVLRRNLRDLKTPVNELFNDLPLLSLLGEVACIIKQDVIAQTRNGFSIVKKFDDGMPRIVTWVSSKQQAIDQVGVNAEPKAAFQLAATHTGKDLFLNYLDLILEKDGIKKDIWTSYIQNRGLTDPSQLDPLDFEKYALDFLFSENGEIISGLKRYVFT